MSSFIEEGVLSFQVNKDDISNAVSNMNTVAYSIHFDMHYMHFKFCETLKLRLISVVFLFFTSTVFSLYIFQSPTTHKH